MFASNDKVFSHKKAMLESLVMPITHFHVETSRKKTEIDPDDEQL